MHHTTNKYIKKKKGELSSLLQKNNIFSLQSITKEMFMLLLAYKSSIHVKHNQKTITIFYCKEKKILNIKGDWTIRPY